VLIRVNQWQKKSTAKSIYNAVISTKEREADTPRRLLRRRHLSQEGMKKIRLARKPSKLFASTNRHFLYIEGYPGGLRSRQDIYWGLLLLMVLIIFILTGGKRGLILQCNICERKGIRYKCPAPFFRETVDLGFRGQANSQTLQLRFTAIIILTTHQKIEEKKKGGRWPAAGCR